MRRLYRSRTNKIIAGVCGGIAERYSLNPWMVRVIFVAAGIFIFVPLPMVIIYLSAWLFIPKAPEAPETTED